MAKRKEIIYTKQLVVDSLTGETYVITKDLDMSKPIVDRDYIENTIINDSKVYVDSMKYSHLF